MTTLYTIDHARITGNLRNYVPIKQYFCLLPYNDSTRPLIVPQKYLINLDVFCFLAIILLKVWILSQLWNILFLLHSMIKTNHILRLFQNHRISTANCFSILPKPLHRWYKQNTKLNINRLLLKIRHLFETLLKIFHQYSIIVLFAI